MKYTPSLAPVAEAPDNRALREIQRAQAISAVRERLFPARIAGHYPQHDSDIEQPAKDRGMERRLAEERRNRCRRITPAEPLLDTRSDVERRKKNRRSDDIATSVDEEA